MLVDDKQAREKEFEEWFLYNYPPGCILSNPSWHVGKIYRAATSSLSAQVAELKKDAERRPVLNRTDGSVRCGLEPCCGRPDCENYLNARDAAKESGDA